MTEQLKELWEKLPLMPMLLLFLGYLTYDAYIFMTDPASEFGQKRQDVVNVQGEEAANRDKLKKAQEFYRTLEARRSELRDLALQLEQAKASISEQMDISSFIRLAVSEAKKVGLTVDGIQPTEQHEAEYYVQQAFDLNFHGVYIQVVAFLQHLSSLERIVRVGEVKMKPVETQGITSEFVELEGSMQLFTYRYRGSKADELGQSSKGAPVSTAQPSSAHPPGAAGGPKQ